LTEGKNARIGDIEERKDLEADEDLTFINHQASIICGKMWTKAVLQRENKFVDQLREGSKKMKKQRSNLLCACDRSGKSLNS